MDEVWKTVDELARRFAERDGERGVAREQQWTLQVLKIGEEFGEAAQAVIGAMGTNPRKGLSHTWDDVHAEVADTAITALVALARMRGGGAEAAAFLREVLEQKSAAFLGPAGRQER
jgi:hypothetical protein